MVDILSYLDKYTLTLDTLDTLDTLRKHKDIINKEITMKNKWNYKVLFNTTPN